MARYNDHKVRVTQDNIGNIDPDALDVFEYAEVRVRRTLKAAFDALDDELKNGKGNTRLSAARTIFEMTGVLKSKIFDPKKPDQRDEDEAFAALTVKLASLPPAKRALLFANSNAYDDEVISTIVPLDLPAAPK
jgi:hypothetical protein